MATVGGYYESQGVVWLDEPVPASRFTDGPWTHATPGQAALLTPGEAMTDTWEQAREDGDQTGVLLLLPGSTPHTVTGIAWNVHDDGEPTIRRWQLFDYLDEFAARAPGAHAVIWGVGAGYEISMFPEVFTYTPDKGFHAEDLPEQQHIKLFHPAQRRTAQFATPGTTTGVGDDIPTPPPVPDENRRRVLAEAAALLKARHCSPESLDVVLRLVDYQICPKCQGWGQTTHNNDGGTTVRRCRTCGRSGTVPRPPVTPARGAASSLRPAPPGH